MKERNEQIDQIIRSRLDDYSSSSPADLWDRIDAERSQQKDDDRGIIWWRWGVLAGLLILMTSVGTYVWQQSSAEVSIERPDQLFSKETLIAAEKPSDTALPSDTKSFSNSKTNDQDQLLLSLEDVKTNSAKPVRQDKGRKDNSNSDALTSTPRQQVPTISQQYLTPSIAKGNENVIEATTIERLPILTDEKTASAAIAAAPSSEAISNKHFKAIDLPTLSQPLAEKSLELLDEDLIEVLPRGCYSFPGGAFKYDFYVDAIGSAELTMRSLDAKNSEFSDYAQNREESEKSMYAFSTGVRLSFVTESGFALRSGLIYSQILERFDYKNGSSERWTIEVNYDDNGNVISIDSTLESGTRIKSTYNRYRSVDIPVILGYEIYGKHFNFNINGGAYFNIWSKQKGEFLSNSSNQIPVKFNSADPTTIQPFHDRLGVSLYGSLGMNYKLSETLQLLIEPNLRYQLHSITIDDYPVSQKYINIGLMTGLRMQF